jgi:hypothetical protein
LARCLLLYQPILKSLLQVVNEDFPELVFRNLFPPLQILSNATSQEGLANFQRASLMVLLNREIHRRWSQVMPAQSLEVSVHSLLLLLDMLNNPGLVEEMSSFQQADSALPHRQPELGFWS